MTQTTTLGQTLFDRLEAEKADGMVRLTREAREAGADAQQDLKAVLTFFEEAKAKFTDAIEQGLTVPTVLLGYSHNAAAYKALNASAWKKDWGIDCAANQYHPVWLGFVKWCTDNDLKGAFKECYDDRESWWSLSVEPADSVKRR